MSKQNIEILRRDTLVEGGFAGLKEHRLGLSLMAAKGRKQTQSLRAGSSHSLQVRKFLREHPKPDIHFAERL